MSPDGGPSIEVHVPGPGEVREDIRYLAHALHVAVDDAVRLLGHAPNVYHRGGKLVRIATGDDEHDDDGQGPRIVEIGAAGLRVAMARVLRVCHPRKGKDGEEVWAPGRVPDDLVKAVLERGAWPGVRELVGVDTAPFLRPDGTICSSAGYDPSTKIILAPAVEVMVPDHPTKADAAAALATLEGLFDDFPHANRAHKLVPVAALLTLVGRHAIRGNMPMVVTDASTRGSGKTLQGDVVAMIATGRPAPKMAWSADPAEQSKTLSSVALAASPLVNLDNISGPIGGADLERVLTAGGLVAFRGLGGNEIVALPWNTLVFASGNNVTIAGDNTRRVLVSRLVPTDEHPELREKFTYPDILAHVLAHRSELLSAALTILRAYHVAGCPAVKLRPWGSFEAWRALVPSAIAWAGGDGADVMGARLTDSEDAHDPEKAFLQTVLDHWPRLSDGAPITASTAIGALYPRDHGGPPDGFDDLREAIEAVTRKPRPDATALGHALRKVKDRYVGGRRLVCHKNPKGAAKWEVVDK